MGEAVRVVNSGWARDLKPRWVVLWVALVMVLVLLMVVALRSWVQHVRKSNLEAMILERYMSTGDGSIVLNGGDGRKRA